MAYGTDEGLQDWAAENGYELPDGVSPSVMRAQGTDYVDGAYGDPLAPRTFIGVPTNGWEQQHQWPRTGVVVYGRAVPDDVIPAQVINAAYFAGLQWGNDPTSLSAEAGQSGTVKREKIGDLETEYFGPGDASTPMVTVQFPSFSYVEGLLAPFLTGSLSAASIGLWSVGPRRRGCG